MPTECAESGCTELTDSGICQQCAAEQKYGTTSRAYNADGTRKAQLREGETRDDDNTHAGDIVARQLAEADEETLEEIDEDEREVRTDGGYYCENCEDSGVIPPGDFADGDDCPNCDGDPLNAFPHTDRPHPPDYDCPDCEPKNLAADGGTEQQPLTEQDPFEATIAVDDLEELAAALKPTRSVVTLECTTSELSVAASDIANVYATRVTKPIDATQPETLVVDTTDLADAIDELRWSDDDATLETVTGDDPELWVFDGDENRTGYQPVPLYRETDAQERPTFDGMIETCDWSVRATTEVWELAGTLRKVATPSHYRVDVMIDDGTFAAIGNDRSRKGDPDPNWSFVDTFEIDPERSRPGVTIPLSSDYLCSTADALPMRTDVTLRFGTETPFWLETDTGVEIFLAPRILDDEDDVPDRETIANATEAHQ